MNLDLTAQIVDDFEKLRQQVENPTPQGPTPEEVKQFEREIGRLAGEVRRLEQVIEGLELAASKTATLHQEGLSKARDEAAATLAAVRASHAEELDRKKKEVTAARAEAAQKVKAAEEAAASLARKSKAIDEAVKKRISADKEALERLVRAEMEKARARAVAEVEDQVASLAYVPLGMRLAALVLDVLAFALAGAVFRYATGWGANVPDRLFVVGACTAFSLRTFVSPGNILLGVSARHIGPDQKPEGPAGLRARLVCGLLHYGPLVASVVAAVSDEPTVAGLRELLAWFDHPFTGPLSFADALNAVIRPATPSLPGVILAATLAWWGLLLLAIAFSPLIHWGTPYFRNTTLVESMWRVGFQRFAPPVLDARGAAEGG